MSIPLLSEYPAPGSDLMHDAYGRRPPPPISHLFKGSAYYELNQDAVPLQKTMPILPIHPYIRHRNRRRSTLQHYNSFHAH
jgi:hypothetical protein